MAMPVTDDCNPAIAGAVRRFRPASVSGSLQASVQLAFDHGLDEAAHPITHRRFNRIEPVVEKIHSGISDRLRAIMLRADRDRGRAKGKADQAQEGNEQIKEVERQPADDASQHPLRRRIWL